MKSQIDNIIVSNQFINPKHPSWKLLIDQNQKLNFLEIGEFNKLLINVEKKTSVNIILFFQEIEKNNQTNTFVDLIKSVCKKTEKEVIVSFSLWEKYTNINYSKNNIKLNSDLAKIEKKFRKIQKKFPNLFLINLDNFFAEKGYEKCFSDRDYFLFSSRLSSFGTEILVKNISEIYLKLKQNPIKVLVFDCDNTLWGGVLGEDGFKNIKIGQDGLGKIYSSFQNEILKLSKLGYLIAISSKNNFKDVLNVFENHKMMKLKKKNIVSFKVNWHEKYKNLIEISKDLNLGLNSFFFWDDNPIEREKMKKFLPDVNTADVDKDISNWPNQLKNHFLLSKFKITKEDLKKLNQYKMVGKFVTKKNSLKKKEDEISFLKSIKLVPKLIKIDNSVISRASQMTLKTNQFNFRTKRYSESNISELIKNKDNIIFLVKLKDVFGDHGIISMFILKKINKDYCFLDTMLMSCRVLGRYLDYWILNQCRALAMKKSYKYIISEFITTDKNRTFEISLKNNGFTFIDNSYVKSKKLNLNCKHKMYLSNVKKYISDQEKIFN